MSSIVDISGCTNAEDETENTITPSYKSAEINKLTLELFMNKSQYQKYLGKTDPKKYEEHKQYLSNVNKYKSSILQMTEELLEDSKKQITTEVNEIFEIYTKTLIDHLQQKEYEYADDDNNNNDEDMLFGHIEESSHTGPMPMQSFWGKDRVVKKPQTQMEYDLQLFSRGRTK